MLKLPGVQKLRLMGNHSKEHLGDFGQTFSATFGYTFRYMYQLVKIGIDDGRAGAVQSRPDIGDPRSEESVVPNPL